MKEISASIIVFSGALLFAVGSLSHGDAQTYSWIAGGIVTLMGLLGWRALCFPG